jgi:hypothetical protein
LDALANLASHLEAWWTPIISLAALIGLWLTATGLIALSSKSQGGRGRALAALASGALLVNLPELMDALSQTLLSNDSLSPLSYAAPKSHSASSLVKAAVLAIGLVGLIGVARGAYLLRLAPAEGGGLPRALVHMAGGVVCVNLPEFLRILAAALGGDAQALVASIVG